MSCKGRRDEKARRERRERSEKREKREKKKIAEKNHTFHMLETMAYHIRVLLHDTNLHTTHTVRPPLPSS